MRKTRVDEQVEAERNAKLYLEYRRGCVTAR